MTGESQHPLQTRSDNATPILGWTRCGPRKSLPPLMLSSVVVLATAQWCECVRE